MSDTVWRSMTRGEYDTFAADQRAAHGLPVAGVNAATGEPAPDGVGVTRDLYSPVVIDETDVRVELPADLVPTKLDKLRRTVEVGEVVGPPQYRDDGALDVVASKTAMVERRL